MASKALSFNRLNAEQLGQRLLRWCGSNDSVVDTAKVKKGKKNKGKKRPQWQQEAWNYHHGLPKGTPKGQGKGGSPPDVEYVPGDDEAVGGAPRFADAPWRQRMLGEGKEDQEKKEEKEEKEVKEGEDDEPDKEVGPPLGKKPRKDDDNDDSPGPRKIGFCAIFGP